MAGGLRSTFVVVGILTLGACGDDPPPAPRVQAVSASASPSEAALAATPGPENEPAPPAFPGNVRSLRLLRSITVRLEPREDSPRLGTLAAHTHVAWKSAQPGPGCEARWIEIEPRGWICESYFETSDKAPEGVELPRLLPGLDLPAEYGKVHGEDAVVLSVKDGAVVAREPLKVASMVRKVSEQILEGRRYWNIGDGKLIAESLIDLYEPSRFAGIRLDAPGAPPFPLGYAISSGRPGDWINVYDSPDGTERKRRVAARTVVTPLETLTGAEGNDVAYRIGDGEWILAKDVRMARLVSPPPTTLPKERWIDIDLDRQILVAYEGSEPVFVTLVASGTAKNETETGIFRVWIKFSEIDMSGRMGDPDAYSVAQVPWTQFYAVDFALHTSYWHDRFGQKRSHGCVNLSPRDARYLYFWSDPQVAAGWTMVNGIVEHPGSMVRVHSSQDPDPEFRGYAEKVYEARLKNQEQAKL